MSEEKPLKDYEIDLVEATKQYREAQRLAREKALHRKSSRTQMDADKVLGIAPISSSSDEEIDDEKSENTNKKCHHSNGHRHHRHQSYSVSTDDIHHSTTVFF
ncbi:hypothetical protein WA158_002098 [Blastocystis sp. Blastoise]